MAEAVLDFANLATRVAVAAAATTNSDEFALSAGKRGFQLRALAQTAALGPVAGGTLIVYVKVAGPSTGIGFQVAGVFQMPPDGSAMLVDIPLPAYNAGVVSDNTRVYCKMRAGTAEIYYTVVAAAY